MEHRHHIPSLFYIVAAVALVVLIASFGAPLPWLPFAEIALNHPTVASSDGSYAAIATDLARKVLIVDAQGKLCASIDYETFEAPIEVVTDVCVSEGQVYVAGVRHKPDSDAIALERVVAYGMTGEQQGIVYEREGQGTSPFIRSLDDAEGGVQVCVASRDDENRTSLKFLLVGDGTQRELASAELGHDMLQTASYAPKTDKIVTLSKRGIINDEGDEKARQKGDRLFTSLALDDDGILLATDDLAHALCEVADDGTVTQIADTTGCTNMRLVHDTIALLDSDANEVLVFNKRGDSFIDLTSVIPRLDVSLRVLSLWVCAAYLVVFAIVLALRHVRRLMAQGELSRIVAFATAFVVALTVGLTLWTSASYSYDEQLKTRTNEVNAYADYLGDMAGVLSKPLSDVASRSLFRDTSPVSDEQRSELMLAYYQIDDLIDSAEDNGIGVYYALYGKDASGIYCIGGSLEEHLWGESISESESMASVRDAFEQREDTSTEIHRGTSRYEDTLYRTVYIPATKDDADGIVIEVGSRMKSLASSVASNLVRNGLALLVLDLVIYMAYSEMQACGRCVLRYREMQQRGEKGYLSALARPFALTTMMLASVDGVMSTLIAKELLTAAGMGDKSALVTVPAIMLGVGQALGQGVYGKLGSRVALRKLMRRCAMAMLVCALAAAAAVASGSFVAYCAAKLLVAIPYGLLYTAAYSLRRHAVTPEQQQLAKAGVKRSNTSSVALGTAIGGYAAQILGNAGVYIMIALVSLAVIVMAVILIPKVVDPPESDRDFSPEEDARIRRFLLSPAALAIGLCIILPSVVATGYASTLFPLFSAELGFSKADINNMYLFGQLIVYVSIGWIERLSKQIGNWRAGDYSIAGLGLVFLGFSLNNTVVWGVVVIALVGLLVKIANAWKPLWITSAGKANVPLGWATGAMFVVRSVARIAKPFILSGLLLVSGRMAVVIIGVFCLVCAATLFLATRKEW